jgi:2-polyprenyl-6-methoxyphenol hydroxylase-like FAD-dependent oxidoreductase
VGELHRYPLVAVYARRFIAPRFALLGDAAVGMHPVTAHGYNFGLYGVDSLTRALRAARAGDRDIGAEAVLRHYEREHRSVTLPIFLGTNALVKLYTDDRRPARAVRRGLLRVANRLPPVKGWIARQLGEA